MFHFTLSTSISSTQRNWTCIAYCVNTVAFCLWRLTQAHVYMYMYIHVRMVSFSVESLATMITYNYIGCLWWCISSDWFNLTIQTSNSTFENLHTLRELIYLSPHQRKNCILGAFSYCIQLDVRTLYFRNKKVLQKSSW